MVKRRIYPPANFHRKNGISCPLDPLQVLTWILTACPCICFFAIQFPFLERTQTYFWMVMFLVFYIIGVILFVFATLCEHTLPPCTSPDHTIRCRYCRKGVPNTAKHCRRCNQCRCGFDHHCRFINNCVTESNYTTFYFGCLFLESTMIIGLVHCFISLVKFLQNEDVVLKRMSDYYNRPTSKLAFWILLILCILLDFGIATPMTVLIIYHVFFQRINVSTYDYLIKNYGKVPKIQKFLCGSKGSRVATY